MGPLFINQRRNSKSLYLEGVEGDTDTRTTTAIDIGTSTSGNASRNNNERLGLGLSEDDKDSRSRSNNGTTTPTTTTINVNVTPCKNSVANSNPNLKGNNNNNNSHVRSVATGAIAINTANTRRRAVDSTSSTEDLSNNEEFSWLRRNQTMKNRISGSANNTEMNPGQFLMMHNPNPLHQHNQHQQNRLLRKSQSNSQIANGGGNPNPQLMSNNNNNNGSIKGNTGSSANISNNPNNISNGIRKYLVLLQDCLAIKFVPAGQPHHSQHFHFAFNSNNNDCNNKGNGNNVNNSQINGTTGMESSTAEVDHSLHGLYLYKGFREANLKCYWNATLCEAIQNLDYKGYIVPSTILVFAPSRFLSVLRTAWSRKMLRFPPGYKVFTVGEIEEFVAEPIPQGQFAPLSDSLCWAILELTSSSQEAFVDSIIFALSTAFPSMTLPSKELVYQTLEKLIKDRKIYQTSRGYFVVTPDTFRYMNSGGDWSHFNSQSSATLPLDALMTSIYDSDRVSLSGHSWGSGGSGNNVDDLPRPTVGHGHSHLKRHNSLKVIRQRDLDLLAPSMGARSLSFRLAKPRSVFDSDREDKYSSSRSKSSTMDSNTEGSSPGLKDSTSEDDNNGTKKIKSKEKSKSRKRSFFLRWFSFRRSKSKVKHIENKSVHLESLPRSPKTYSSISRVRQSQSSINNNAATQTITRSYENVHDLIEHLDLSNEDEHLYLQLPRRISKWNSLPSSGTRNRNMSRRSIVNESPFYDTLTYKTDVHATNPIPTRDVTVDGIGKYSTRSAVSSSLGYGSQGTYPHHMTNVPIPPVGLGTPLRGGTDLPTQRLSGGGGPKTIRTDSPCPSTSASAIYASIANSGGPMGSSAINAPASYRNMTFDNVYRRRNSTQNANPQSRYSNIYTSRPKSAYELLAYQNQMYKSNRKKSMESLVPQTKQIKTSVTNKPFVSTTTITQNVTSTTNSDLEVLLPLGKKNLTPTITTLNDMKTDDAILHDDSSKSTVVKMRSQPTKTQITTTVNNNGTVETHFSSSTGSININNRLEDNCHCNKDSDVSH